MIKKEFAYPNLKAELSRYNIKAEDLSNLLGIAKPNVYNRLTGEKDFTLSEMITIQTYLELKATNKKFELEYLFSREAI